MLKGLPQWGRSVTYSHYNIADVKLEGELSDLGTHAHLTHLATSDHLSGHATAVQVAILLDVQTTLKG